MLETEIEIVQAPMKYLGYKKNKMIILLFSVTVHLNPEQFLFFFHTHTHFLFCKEREGLWACLYVCYFSTNKKVKWAKFHENVDGAHGI
jgi:hypothetical protein